MNNTHSTEVAFILDRSGSMESCRDAAIQGFNRFLADQQSVEGLAKLTLAPNHQNSRYALKQSVESRRENASPWDCTARDYCVSQFTTYAESLWRHRKRS
jgi:hypothetical protein